MNLLGKLYYVYFVFPPTSEDPNFVAVNKVHDDWLGCSHVKGIFRYKQEAVEFAVKLSKKNGVKLYA